MSQLVTVTDGKAKVSSKTVADAFGKIHRNVLRDISALECSAEFRALNFEQSSYTSEQNKVLPCYEMTRDGFCFLAMGFTGQKAGEWKEKFIKAFNQLESDLISSSKSAMASLSEAIHLMESDKERASAHGKALSSWKRVRKDHIEAVTQAHSRAQIVLNFKA